MEENLLHEIGQVATMRRAWLKVRANGGMPGIDRVSIETFEQGLEGHLEELARGASVLATSRGRR
jgi:hypothetical protein